MGGDILDEPHDAGDDSEPFLGWPEPAVHCSHVVDCMPAVDDPESAYGLTGTRYDGTGYGIGNGLLRSQGIGQVRVSPGLLSGQMLTVVGIAG